MTNIPTMKKMKQKFDYDVALSFAGEDREYVNEVASILKSKGVSVFYYCCPVKVF